MWEGAEGGLPLPPQFKEGAEGGLASLFLLNLRYNEYAVNLYETENNFVCGHLFSPISQKLMTMDFFPNFFHYCKEVILIHRRGGQWPLPATPPWFFLKNTYLGSNQATLKLS